MRYITSLVLTAVLLCAGCSSSREAAPQAEQPELVFMTSLPPVDLASFRMGTKLNVLVHIRPDGTVENVRMLGSSGDQAWDSLAVRSMTHWRYAPPRRDGAAAGLWFRQLVVVQVQEPLTVTVGELAVRGLREADSLEALLNRGADLDSLFRRAIRTVDLLHVPQHLRDALGRLGTGQHTSPLKRGQEYVIYKRFDRVSY